MCEGPIPWTSIAAYADREDLDVDASRSFIRVMQMMDSTYLEWREKNRSKK